MGNFRSGGSRGRDGGSSFGGRGGGRDRGSFGGSRGGGFGRGRDDRSSGPREMFDATCSKCGKACRVPFRPTGNKPVLCSDCFGNTREGSSRGSFSNRPMQSQSFSSPASNDQLAQVNMKLDKILAIMKELELDIDEDVTELEEDLDDSDEDDEDDSEEEEKTV